MLWKVTTIVLAVALAATIGLGEWQLNRQWNRTVNSEAQIVALVRQNQVAESRNISSLQSQEEKALGAVSGATVGGLLRVIGSSAIGNDTLTGAISNLQQSVSCLETDIADIENQSSTYLLCN
jgi:outer membrane lipoprotein SlyB